MAKQPSNVSDAVEGLATIAGMLVDFYLSSRRAARERGESTSDAERLALQLTMEWFKTMSANARETSPENLAAKLMEQAKGSGS